VNSKLILRRVRPEQKGRELPERFIGAHFLRGRLEWHDITRRRDLLRDVLGAAPQCVGFLRQIGRPAPTR
jgi:hypothetical protein